MRRMLHILKWTGLSLSTLLLAATVFCWVRSMGYDERWNCERFEAWPNRLLPATRGLGLNRKWHVWAIHGRLWLGSATEKVVPEFQTQAEYLREAISGNVARQNFELEFQPCQWQGEYNIHRAWNFAGAGFRHRRHAADPVIHSPNIEDFFLALPFWMLAVVFGLWPVGFVAWRLLRKKRHAPGHCPQCGYDLRATPDPSGPRLPRCPECGWHSHERHSPERETDT